MTAMQERFAQGPATPQEAGLVAAGPKRHEHTLANIRYLRELGAPIVAGSHAGWRYPASTTSARNCTTWPRRA